MKAEKLSKKLISIILTIMMLATMLPATSVHTHAADDNSGVTLEYSGTEVADSTIIDNTNQKVKVYTITDSGEYVLKTSGVSEYGVAIILDRGVSDVRLVLDNVSIFAQKPIMPDVINDISYNNSIHGGLVIYNNSDDISDLEIIIKGSNMISVSCNEGYETSAMLVRGCNTSFYGYSEENNLILSNNSSSVVSYGLVNLTKDGFVGGSVPFETAPYLGMNSDAKISVDVQQGSGIITARDINIFDSRLSVHSYGVAIQSYVDEGILENGYYGLYVDNSSLSVDSSGAGIGINNGGVAFVDGTDLTINSTSIALTVCSGNITFDNINNVDIRSNDGYGLSLNDSTLAVDFNSDNVSIYGEQYAIMGMSQYVTNRGFVGDNEIITLHSDDGINYSEYTDDETTKKYVKTSTRAHTHDFGEDYYESDVAGYHYKLCDCGEMSEPEECTYSFHYFESAPDIENDGVKVYFCDYCGGRKDVTVPAHDCYAYTDFEIDDFGNHYGYCTYVGCERFIDEPHNLELLEELDDNSHKHICAVCDYYEVEDHLFVEFEYIDEDTHEAYCECGYTVVKPHEYFEFSGNNDGETHTGYCYCGAEITGDHNWSDWSETGNGHMRTCDVCGAEEHGAHQWDDWYGISMLQHQHECQVCHRIENVDHVWDNDWVNRGENGHSQDCLDCGWRITEDHEFEKCGDNGDGTHTGYCFCGAEVTGTHNWGDWEEAEDGSGTFHTCNDCYATEYCSHEWGDWYGISNLQHQHKCEICGTTEDSRHTWDDWTDNGTTHSHDCSGCGWRITEEHDYINIQDDENGTTHTAYCICGKGITSEHDWSPWIDTEDGHHRRECNECGAEEIGEHNWGEWESINEESHQRFCLDCESAREEGNHNLTENWVDIGEDGHRFGCVDCDYGTIEPHEINEWLPGEDGETHVGYCFCGAVIVEEHQWSEWTDLGNRHERSCTVCGETQSGSHSVSSYTYDDEGHRGECDYCHRVFTGSHSYTTYNSIDNHSHQSSCNVCGYVETSAHTPLLGYVNNGDGTHSATCSKCRSRYTSAHVFVYEQYDIDYHKYACDCCNEDELLPHNWSEWESLADGSCVRYCLDCNQEHICSHESITYIHNENNHTGICDTCGWTKTSEHKNEDGFIPNNDGKHYYVCVCGYCYVEDHSFVCTDNRDGTHTATCICGHTVIEDHSYNYETIIHSIPTETEPGIKYDCCACGAYSESRFVSFVDINGDDVVDIQDYQLMVNEVISGGNEQSGTAEYDEIIKYDLNGDGYVDALDTSLMSLVVRGHKSFADIQNGQRGDIDFDGEAFTDVDLIELYYILSDIELSALTLSTNQKFAADLNCNGRIDEDDYILLQQLYPGIHDMV